MPVYKVQLVDETTKFRVLHRHLLFPLTMRKESDEKQKVVEINEQELTNSDGENNASSEQINSYEGAVTRSKTKGIKKYIVTQS